MASKELYQLLRVLDERDIPLGRDHVAWAFENTKTKEATTSWIHEYLTPSTLLTKEESNFHEKRPSTSSGASQALTSRPLTDADFEAAISSLEQSTQAIEQQCRMLEAQRKALQHLNSRDGKKDSVRDFKENKQKTLGRNKAQLDFEINKLSDTLQTKLSASSKHCDNSVSGISNSIDRILEKDDRLLDGIQKLLPKLETDGQQDADLEAEVERLCNLLTSLTIQEIHERMDTAFTSNSTVLDTPTNGIDKKSEKQRHSLRAELTELCNEIDGLATMAVDTRFRLSIRRALKTSKADANLERGRWSEYIVTSLRYLTARLEVLTDHFEHLHAHHGALKQAAGSLEKVLAQQPPQVARDAGTSVAPKGPATPVAKGLKPLRLVQAHSEADPATQLLRCLGVKGVVEAADGQALAAGLRKAVRTRAVEVRDLEGSTARVVSDAVAGSLARGHRDVEALVRAVYVFSRFGGARVVEEGVEGRLGGLEQVTERVGGLMRGLDVESVAREVRRRLAEVTGE